MFLRHIARMFTWIAQAIWPGKEELPIEPPLPPPVEPEPEPAPPPPEPIPVPVPPPAWLAPLPPLQGQLRTDDLSFLDDTGRRIPIFCHAGDLLLQFVEARTQNDMAKEARVHQAFLDMQRAGYSGLRSWWSICWQKYPHRYWGNRRLNPSNAEHRRLLTEAFRIGAEDYGLQWHLALGDADEVPREEIEDAWRWLANLVHSRPQWFALIEGLNEACHTGEDDPREVEWWVNISRLQNPEVLHVLSAGEGAAKSEEIEELEKWTPAWQKVYLVHASRANHWGDQTRHAFSTGYKRAPRRLGWSGEPPGMQWGEHRRVSSMDHPEEWTESPWRYALYLAQTAIARQVPTFMCSHGVVLEGRFQDAPGFNLAPRLINDLPHDVMTFAQLIHGGTRWKDERVIVAPDHGRADHALSTDGRVVITIYPENPEIRDTDLVIEKAWRGRVHDSVGYTDVVMEKGARWNRDISSGLLLVGELL